VPTPDNWSAGDPPRERRPWAGYLLVGVGVAVLVAAGFGALVSRDDETPAPEIAAPIAAAIGDAATADEPFPGLTETQRAVGEDCLRLVVVDILDERAQGLRGRSSLGPYDGMLFVFEGTSQSAFTMQGVPVPLDIGWYDEAGQPVDRAEMVPCPESLSECPPYTSRRPYRFALETLRGELPGGPVTGCG